MILGAPSPRHVQAQCREIRVRYSLQRSPDTPHQHPPEYPTRLAAFVALATPQATESHRLRRCCRGKTGVWDQKQ